jgi:signal transduction histidine kinase
MEEYLATALGASQRMVRVLAVFGKSRMDIDPKIVNLIEVIATQTNETYPGLQIELDATEKTQKVQIRGGRLIPMVFDNMFRNVVDYAGEDAKIWIKVRSSRGEVRVDITDSGPGISEGLQATLFQRGASTSGGGLGLHLSRRIIEAYGGTLELLHAKTKSRGATFRITLPIA